MSKNKKEKTKEKKVKTKVKKEHIHSGNQNFTSTPKVVGRDNQQNSDDPLPSKDMPDHIERFMSDNKASHEERQSKEIFEAKDNNIDLKTHLRDEEISLINILKFNDAFLKSKGLKPVYRDFITQFMRLKVSKDRLSRQEFVRMNSGGVMENQEAVDTKEGFDKIIKSRT